MSNVVGGTYQLRMHQSLVSGFHADAVEEECPEVFRGNGGAWISCNHESHSIAPDGHILSEGERRVHLLRDVIPGAADRMAARDAEVLESRSRGVSRPRSQGGGKEAKDCACGCGERTRGGRFIPGHDAKLRGRLIRAAQDTDLAREDRVAALHKLDEMGWSKFVKDDIKRSVQYE